ncbi:MAG: NAD-dependent epimerase/dehydratase family protein [Thermoanaerobaculales bacterium]|nr:NAD-dependent epimerase/dehydratase family protein [Thermoanaerobaculales bacterium]
MRALVTGGLGFIGSHLVNALLVEGWQVVIFDRAGNPFFPVPTQARFVEAELGNRGALSHALKGVDVVFHLAWSGENLASTQDLRAHVECNLLSSLSLFELCEKAGVRRLVFFSSGGTVYGKADHVPIAEDHPRNPISPYGLTKLTVERFLEFHGSQFGMDSVIVRPSVPYGERQNPNGVQGAVSVFLGKAMCGEPIVIWGDGTVVRDYFYVGDLAQACIAAAQTSARGEVFNIGGGMGISLNQLVEMVRGVTGIDVEVVYQAARSFDVPELVLDIRKAEEILAWKPVVGLEEGLERTWEWIQSLQRLA